MNETFESNDAIAAALARAGENEALRTRLMDALRQAENNSEQPQEFRRQVRWPIVYGLLQSAGFHRMKLQNGLVFDIFSDSRIEQSALLAPEDPADHVWEPQTTKLLLALSKNARNVIVGGAYIGDQVIPIAHQIAPNGIVHAFEPMQSAFGRLQHNTEINGLNNIRLHRLGLWDKSDIYLDIEGASSLAAAQPVENGEAKESVVASTSIDAYVSANQLDSVELLMLDIEGGEEKALQGARELLSTLR